MRRERAKRFGRTAVGAFLCACVAACASGPSHPAGWTKGADDAWTSGTQRYAVTTAPFNGDLKALGGQAVGSTVLSQKVRFTGSRPYPPCPGLGIILTFEGKNAPFTLQEVLSIRDGQATTISYTRDTSAPDDPVATKAIIATICHIGS